MDRNENLQIWRGQFFGDNELIAETYAIGSEAYCEKVLTTWWEELDPALESPFAESSVEMQEMKSVLFKPEALQRRGSRRLPSDLKPQADGGSKQLRRSPYVPWDTLVGDR